jgi:hypothetical protein
MENNNFEEIIEKLKLLIKLTKEKIENLKILNEPEINTIDIFKRHCC